MSSTQKRASLDSPSGDVVAHCLSASSLPTKRYSRPAFPPGRCIEISSGTMPKTRSSTWARVGRTAAPAGVRIGAKRAISADSSAVSPTSFAVVSAPYQVHASA